MGFLGKMSPDEYEGLSEQDKDGLSRSDDYRRRNGVVRGGAEDASFPFFFSFRLAVESLPRQRRGRFLLAIIDFAVYDIWPRDLKGTEKALFELIAGTIQRYFDKRESGKLGGRGNKRRGEADAPEAPDDS